MNAITYIYRTSKQILDIEVNGYYVNSMFDVTLEIDNTGTMAYDIKVKGAKLPVGYIPEGYDLKILD